MADDPIIYSLRKEQREKESIYWQISGIFSYFINQDSHTYAVKSFSISGKNVVIVTVDNSGNEQSWTGGGKSGSIICSQRSKDSSSKTYAGLSESQDEQNQQLETELMVSRRKPSTIYIKDQNVTRALEVLHTYPFPYYKKMPLYNKFLCFKALTGTIGPRNESEFVGRIHFGVINLSIKEDGEDLREDIRSNVRAGIEAGIITENHGLLRLSRSALNSKASFSRIYERYYLRINKTTLYDF